MNDNDIAKALKCCANKKQCSDCPFCATSREPCYITLAREAASLLARREAEIERLNGCVKTEEEVRVIAKETILAGVKIIRAEAIKEFVERLKATPYRFRMELTIDFDKPPITKMVLFVDDNDIDNLAKEMTEEQP